MYIIIIYNDLFGLVNKTKINKFIFLFAAIIPLSIIPDVTVSSLH